MAAIAQIIALLASEAAGGEGNPLLRITPGLWVWTLIVFFLLFLVLRKWGFGAMVQQLETRDKAIRGAIDDAKQQREQAEKYLEEQRELLAKARREATELLTQAQEQAGRERQRILTEGREEYEKIVARGRSQIEQETRAALTQVRQAAATLAVEVAGKLIQRNLDQPAQQELAERFVREIEQA